MTRDIRLSDYVHLLRRQRWLIAGVMVATTVLGVLLASSEPEVYSSTASVRLTADASDGVFSEAEVDDADRSRELLSEVEVLRSSSMRQEVTARFGSSPPVFFGVRARLVGFSEIIEITVSAPSPVDAANVANAYVDTFIEARRERAVGELTDQIAGLRTQVAESTSQLALIDAQLADPDLPAPVADSLQSNRQLVVAQLQQYTSRADQLEVIADLREGNTERVSGAGIRPQPVSPNVGQSGVAGAVLGLLGGLGLAVVRDLLRDRVNDPDDIAQVDSQAHVLAAVPHMKAQPDGSVVATPEAAEAYRYLRTAVQFAALDGGLGVIAVTSALSGEGKSTTALNLARAVAASGRRVAIIDCDLRRPSLHGQIGLDGNLGVVSVVLGEAALSDVVTYPEPGIAAVPAGAATTTATEILGSERFARLLESIAGQADLTILDVPPVLPVADTLVLGGLLDAVIVVARIGKVRRREVAATLQRLGDADIRVLGVVVNDVPSPESLYGGYSPYIESSEQGRERRNPRRRPVRDVKPRGRHSSAR